MENLFNYNWELCKVGDFGREIYGGGTPKTSVKEFWSGTLPWIQSSDLKEDKVCDIKAKKHISVKAIQQSSAKKISKNSIAIVTRVSVGKLVLMPYEYATSQDFLSISVLQVDKWFGVYSLYNKLQSELNSVQGTSIKGITKDELLNKKIMIPKPLKEQSKIGLFLKKIDTTIALHQRKLDQLKELKKAYLQLIIVLNSSENSTVPKLRFANFTGEWELCKLGDELALLKDGTHGTHTDSLVGPYLLSAKNIKNGKINITNEDRKISQDEFDRIHSRFSLKKDDILLTIVGSIGEAAILRAPEGITFQRSVAYLRSKVINPEFLYTYITGPEFQKELKNRQVVSAQPGIYLGDLDKIPILFPKTSREQQKIGTFFQQLDQAITLHQNKLTQLKFLKKSYLQNMFI
ncbi:restriction endonuclease subunit S [Enterococcus faecalis]|uniref:restriction endonuclease subunit S n=1 Tax=Enterococcus faecalis TaxID=1351 RepID=UPI0001F0AF34|nr:restriction endonuclease subunit S [Enterococcus faecalis]EFU15562.1 type I restriction modification DNA specificity domain protein [Enterococcus faecalis TX1342]